MRQLQILAGAVIEIGSDLRISPYLSDTSQPTLEPRKRGSGFRCGGTITADRDGCLHIGIAILVSWYCLRY